RAASTWRSPPFRISSGERNQPEMCFLSSQAYRPVRARGSAPGIPVEYRARCRAPLRKRREKVCPTRQSLDRSAWDVLIEWSAAAPSPSLQPPQRLGREPLRLDDLLRFRPRPADAHAQQRAALQHIERAADAAAGPHRLVAHAAHALRRLRLLVLFGFFAARF